MPETRVQGSEKSLRGLVLCVLAISAAPGTVTE